MSTQSIYQNTVRSILKKADDFYICQGNHYILQKDYDLGEGADITKFLIVDWYDQILSNNVCYKYDKETLLQHLNSILLK